MGSEGGDGGVGAGKRGGRKAAPAMTHSSGQEDRRGMVGRVGELTERFWMRECSE